TSLMFSLQVDLALYRAENGGFPATLDPLVPNYAEPMPLDPFTDRPFVYKRAADGAGYLLYSVGANGRDDGGHNFIREQSWDEGAPPPDCPEEADDWAVRYPPQNLR
ncbi:MAG: hypothetical protein ACOY3P_00815, partial [Planctomycetota bacterium]